MAYLLSVHRSNSSACILLVNVLVAVGVSTSWHHADMNTRWQSDHPTPETVRAGDPTAKYSTGPESYM